MKFKKILFTLFLIPSLNFAQDSLTITRPKVGVVLSGGGAKGYAHIGALKKIEEAGIKIDYIGGTSMGAIVGGLYAAGKTVGVQISSVQEELANELAETVDMKVESRNLIPEVIQDLMTKRFDAAVIEDVVAENYTQRNKDLTYFPIVVEEIDTKAAVFPEGSELKEKFLAQLLQN